DFRSASANSEIEEMALPTRAKKIPEKLARRAKQILVLLMDVDGTLTDGSVTLVSQQDGHALESKTFDAHDGQGLTLADTAGLRTGAARELVEIILKSKCIWEEMIDKARA